MNIDEIDAQKLGANLKAGLKMLRDEYQGEPVALWAEVDEKGDLSWTGCAGPYTFGDQVPWKERTFIGTPRSWPTNAAHAIIEKRGPKPNAEELLRSQIKEASKKLTELHEKLFAVRQAEPELQSV